jgi:hypothetical protein
MTVVMSNDVVLQCCTVTGSLLSLQLAAGMLSGMVNSARSRQILWKTYYRRSSVICQSSVIGRDVKAAMSQYMSRYTIRP